MYLVLPAFTSRPVYLLATIEASYCFFIVRMFLNIRGISSLAEKLLASREGSCFTDFLTLLFMVKGRLLLQSAEREKEKGSLLMKNEGVTAGNFGTVKGFVKALKCVGN